MTLNDNVIQELKINKDLSPSITYWDKKSEFEGQYQPIKGIHPRIIDALNQIGIKRFYSHQTEAIDSLHDRNNVVIVTGTSSGKSLCYQIPILEKYLETGSSTSLLLFPTKALTYDQLYAFNQIENLVFQKKTLSAVYDGDTSAGLRQSIRKNANILLTNPDMLNIALLPHHTNWASFFRNLQFIVIDELHQYRGVFGSHFSNIIRRLKRILDFYGSKPQFILTSATIGNPKELAEKIIEEQVILIDDDKSPKGEKNIILYNPPFINKELGIREGLLNSTIRISSFFLSHNIQTIVFCGSRRFVEFIVKTMRQKFPNQQSEIRGYRSGYLKSERRDIEDGLKNRSITLAAATNALELGVDIGGVDVILIAGYPGSVSSVNQMSGRAGRHHSASLAMIITSMNPLDQYFARFPESLFKKPVEKALIDPNNPLILLPHIKASAFEYPFTTNEKFGDLSNSDLLMYLDYLTDQNCLIKKQDKYFYLSDSFPAGEYSIRNTSATNIILQINENDFIKTIGEIDYNSSLWMCHPGAVYIHDGIEYHVESVDLTTNIANLTRFSGSYRTESIRSEDISIDAVKKMKRLEYYDLKVGTVDVSSQVTGFKKIDSLSGEILGIETLNMPVTNLNTIGFWVRLNSSCIEKLKQESKWYGQSNDYGPSWKSIRERVLERDGNICQSCGKKDKSDPLQVHHKVPFKAFIASEYVNSPDNLITLCVDCHRLAEINVKIRNSLSGLRYSIANLAPLIVLCDSNDINSISDPYAKFEELSPVVLVHDIVPGGIGLSETLFEKFDLILQKCFDLVSTCTCENGCPSCVGPISENGEGGKQETLFLLSLLMS